RVHRPGRSTSQSELRLEFQNRIGVCTEYFEARTRCSVRALMPDDEWEMCAHVEDRHHCVTRDRVGRTDPGDAIDTAAARTQLEDPRGARGTTHFTLESAAHVAICALGYPGVTCLSRDEELGQLACNPGRIVSCAVARASCSPGVVSDIGLRGSRSGRRLKRGCGRGG